MKKIIIIGFLIMLSGCTSGGDDITIGGILPLSGKGVSYGDFIQKVANLRIEQINESNLLGDRELDIIWRDGECDYEKGQQVAKELINDGVSVIVGGGCSDETLGAALVTSPRKVLLLSPLATTPALSRAGDYVFRTIPSSLKDGELLSYYVIENKVKKVGIIWESNRYTDPIYTSFTHNLEAELIEERIGGDEVNVAEVIGRLRDAEVEAIFINTYSPDTTEEILEGIRDLGYEITILGNSMAVNTFQNIFRNHYDFWEKQVFIGGHFLIDHDTDKFIDFERSYEARYAENIKFPDFMATTLDAIDLLSDAFSYVEDVNNTTEIKNYFHSTQLVGFSGGVSFDKNGDVALPNKLTIFDGDKFVEYEY